MGHPAPSTVSQEHEAVYDDSGGAVRRRALALVRLHLDMRND
jgi:hypothetical protein